MLDDSSNYAADIDAKITYHQEMEQFAIKARDLRKAEHHRNMQEICSKMKEHFDSKS